MPKSSGRSCSSLPRWTGSTTGAMCGSWQQPTGPICSTRHSSARPVRPPDRDPASRQGCPAPDPEDPLTEDAPCRCDLESIAHSAENTTGAELEGHLPRSRYDGSPPRRQIHVGMVRLYCCGPQGQERNSDREPHVYLMLPDLPQSPSSHFCEETWMNILLDPAGRNRSPPYPLFFGNQPAGPPFLPPEKETLRGLHHLRNPEQRPLA